MWVCIQLNGASISIIKGAQSPQVNRYLQELADSVILSTHQGLNAARKALPRFPYGDVTFAHSLSIILLIDIPPKAHKHISYNDSTCTVFNI